MDAQRIYLPWRFVAVGAVENVPRQHPGEQHARGRDGRQLSLGKAQLHYHSKAPFAQVSVMEVAFSFLGRRASILRIP